MKTFINVFVLFIFLSVRINAQQIANFIGNGSFEQLTANCTSVDLKASKYWNSIDSVYNFAGFIFSYCNGMVPTQNNTTYQLPRTKNVFAGTTFYACYGINNYRDYFKNRLKKNLVAGKIYCVKFYVNIMNTSTLGSDGFGIYFGNSTIDTITQISKPLTFIVPQVVSPNGIPIIDTLGWTPVTGTFVAKGDEKYALVGMFKPTGTMDTVINNPIALPLNFTDACIDDVSCIPIDLPAYAGRDTSCIAGTSVYIGRPSDVEIDESCRWYKLPITITPTTPAIDTAAGIWVSPTQTSTYVVRQQLWCSGVRWDTVVVYQDFVGINELKIENEELKMVGSKLIVEKDNLLNYSLSIYDTQGKQLFHQTNINQNFEYNFLENQSGVYIVQIETQQGVLRKKVVYLKE